MSDFYFNSWRLVPANAIWGLGLMVLVALVFSFAPALPLWLGLLAFPTAGIFRLAAIMARDRPAAFSDALEAWRRFLGPILLIGAVAGVGSSILLFNIVFGFVSNDPVGWIFATLALWGFLALWAVALAFWPLLLDPLREGETLSAKLRLAVTVILIAPGRYVALMLLAWLFLLISTILLAALLTVSVAFVALVVSRYVLPLADRIEARATQLLPEEG
jgi:hypothetical protein